MTATSPSARSKAYLREQGWTEAKTEHFNSFAKVLQDLFGFGDYLAMKKGERHLIVQTTTQANAAARLTKIVSDPKVSANARLWLDTNGRIVIHGWAKRGGRGERKLWSVVEREVTVADFDIEAAARREAI